MALTGSLLVGMLAVAVAAPIRYIAPAYAPRPMLTAAELAAAPTQVSIVYGGSFELLGYSPARPTADADGRVRIDLYLRSVSPRVLNYAVSAQLIDETGNVLARDESYPGRGTLPTGRWRSGDAVRESRTLVVPERPEATTARLVVAIHKPGFDSLPARDSSGTDLGVSPVVGRVGIGQPRIAEPAADANRTLGGTLAMVDYAVERREFRVGEPLRGNLVWQCLKPISTDLTVFAQLVGPAGLAAQYDSQPRRGEYPTSWWRTGEVVSDGFSLETAGVRAGQYRLIAGMYDLATGQRLAARDADYIDLGTVRVVE